MVLKNLPPLAGLTFNCNAYPTLRVGLHSVAATRLYSDALRAISLSPLRGCIRMRFARYLGQLRRRAQPWAVSCLNPRPYSEIDIHPLRT